MSLQALDVAVALTAAHQQHVRGTWRPADVHRELDVPWSSLDRSLRRLEVADIVRDGWINRIALSELLPVLRYLFPLVVDREQVVRGLPTSFAARAFEGRVRYTAPLVWAAEDGTIDGNAVEPLHPSVVAASRRNPELGDVFTLVDALRGGRAREIGIATERLTALVDLPAPYARA